MSFRSRRSELSYAHFRKVAKTQQEGCVFCLFNDRGSEDIVEETEHFFVAKNRFRYDVWDNLTVLDHLLLVPRVHTESIATLSTDALVDFAKTLAGYEKAGYSYYARAAGQVTKSIPHQHTHLIKLDTKPKKIIFHLKKPYILFYK
jgi:diadenosine tetraphosphate (Ap4A) HIT family hydrolase